MLEIICFECKRRPDEIGEYIDIANEEGTAPESFVIMEEGTFNSDNGHFCCSECYINIGMPSSPTGWIAP